MDLCVRNNTAFPGAARDLEVLTNYARLMPRQVKHDPIARTVTFPLMRRALLSYRFGFLGRPIATYADEYVPAELVVRNVQECVIEDHSDAVGTKEITLIFGIRLDSNRLALSSAEELSGVHAYGLTALLTQTDVEIVDRAT